MKDQEKKKTSGKRDRGQAERILSVLKEMPNQSVTSNELEQRLGLTRQQVQSAMYSLTKNPLIGQQVERASSGVYFYRSRPAQQKGKLFELLAETHDGRLVLQDETGNVYIANEGQIHTSGSPNSRPSARA